MKTKIIKIDKDNVKAEKIRPAAESLRKGGLVAFPTETVYGLGANALDSKAVKKIFKAKGRPQDNPLIAHIGKKEDINKLVKKIPNKARELMDAFWPGPLTIVLKKSEVVPDVITGGLDSVAVRMPSNDIALALITEAGVPVAAPSANISGRPSPTFAKRVIEDLKGKIDFVIDGGKTKIGVESTVVDLTSNLPVLLRPGGITKEEMEDFVGEVKMGSEAEKNEKTAVKSPGMKYRHYSPKAEVILVEGENAGERMRKICNKYKKEGLKVGVMVFDKETEYRADVIKFIGDNLEEIAMNLFEALREFDEENVDVIIVKSVLDRGLGVAIMNRLRKAASNG